MKRIGALSLLLAVLVSAGCSKAEPKSAAKPASKGNPAYLAVDADGSIARIRKAGALKVGADLNSGLPFWAAGQDADDPATGFEAELATEVAQLIGVEAQVVPTKWTSLLDELKAGRIDVVLNGVEAPSSDAAAKQEDLVYTKPYLEGGEWIVVPPEDKTTDRLADLKGMEVAVLKGSLDATLLAEANKRHKLDIKLAEFAKSKELFTKVETRSVSAAMLPQPMAALFLVQNPSFRHAGEPILPRGYVMVVRREDKALLNTINAWLSKSETDKAYQKLATKWKMQPGG